MLWRTAHATQTDLLEAILGNLPDAEGEEPDILQRPDGSPLIDGLAPAHEILERLGLREAVSDSNIRTLRPGVIV